MAFVRLRKGSPFWYAGITIELPDGKRRQKHFATGLTDKKEALAVAVSAELAAQKHRETPHRMRSALEAIADQYCPTEEINPGEWLKAWAERRKGRVAPSSLATYRNTMAEAAAWMKENGITRFSALTGRTCAQLLDYWASRNSQVTANTKLKHLRIALEEATREHRLEVNPAAKVQSLKAEATVRREFRPDELKALLGAVEGEWRAIVMLGLYTGQRLNDLAALQWRNIDLAAGTITLTTKKTRALVSLPLMQPALDALTALPTADNPTAPVFPGIASQAHTSRSNTFRGILAGIGLASPVTRRKIEGRDTRRQMSELSFHSLRHTATSLLKAAGVTDSIARAIIGHQSEAVSRQYTHLDLNTMRTALEKLPAIKP